MSTYAQRVVRKEIGPCRLFVLKTGVRDVVSVRLSFDTHPDFASGDELVQDVAAALLDKGTRRRDRFELAAVLEDRGASLSFSGSGVRIRASGRMLRDDIRSVIPLLGEILTDPAFDEDEIAKTRQRITGALRRSMSDSHHRAAVELSRHVFVRGHPEFMATPEEELRALELVSSSSLRAYHAAKFRGPVRIVAVGDVDIDLLDHAVADAFSSWTTGDSSDGRYPDPPDTAPGVSSTPIADRPNLDIQLGHSVPVRRDDPEYDALRLGVFALGGNFSARLMGRVRDELGLTYGIGSSLSGIGVHHGGMWQTGLTLSADRLDEGLEATRQELTRFVGGGVTDDEVAVNRETLGARYVVGLATSGGLAAALLAAEENGFGEGYLDDYPNRIGDVTMERVNRVVREYLDPGALHVSIAGSTAP